MKKLKGYVLKLLTLTLVIWVISQLPIIQLINLSGYNQKFLFRGVQKPKSPIVIVAIDDESITWLSKWPWPRSYHAKMVDILSKAGAKLIVFDVFFDSPTQFDPKDDIQFAEAVKRAGNVILAANFQNVDHQAMYKVRQLPFKKPIEILDQAALDIGVVHPHLDMDNVVRNFQLIYKSGNELYPSLALQTAHYLGRRTPVSVIKDNLLVMGQYHIPQHNAKLLINYLGPTKTFPTIPYAQVFDGSFLKDHPDYFKGKIVLIGASAFELHDVFPTPFSVTLPGVEIHANVIETILTGKHIYLLPTAAMLLILVFAVALNLLASSFFKMKQLFIFLVAQIIILFIGCALIFKYYSLEIPTYTLIIALIVTFIVQTTIKFILEEKEKRKIRDVFSQYVAPTVVNELLAHPEKVELGGELKEVTIFFSDIRSFTTFSEGHTPRQVVDQLNEYLDAMTQVIFEFGGTLDKYVGDEIMAVFGAPLPLKDHAKVATRCCVAQWNKLKQLQARWKEEGRTILDFGMGLNTGEVIVGNIGSTMHKDYTVIGDAVNLAARLEAATRKYSNDDYICRFLISEHTYDLIKDEFECRFVDEIAVKGKTKATKIYEVITD